MKNQAVFSSKDKSKILKCRFFVWRFKGKTRQKLRVFVQLFGRLFWV